VFFFQAEDGIRDFHVTGVQTCALPILVADRLGWAVLDSGALYRLTALSVLRSGVNANDVDAVAQLARTLNVTFDGERILLDGKEIGRASCRERGRRTVAAR